MKKLQVNQKHINMIRRAGTSTIQMDRPNVTATIIRARLFATAVMKRSSCQFFISGPKIRFASNQR